MNTQNGRHRREQRAGIAEKNATLRDKRSALEQLKLLDERLGAGVGAKRERAKLQEEMTGKGKKQNREDRENAPG